jgi:hypothetical protein
VVGNIDTGSINKNKEERSLYERLFLNKAVLNPVDQAFKLNAHQTDLEVTTETIESHKPAIQAALGVSAEELDLLTSVTEVIPNNNLSLENLSRLFRVVSFTKTLKLSVREFLSYRSICGVDPFMASDLRGTIQFHDQLKKIENTGFTTAHLDYLLEAEYDIAFGIGLAEEVICIALLELRQGLKKIAEDNAAKDDPGGNILDSLSREFLKQKLSVSLHLEAGVMEQLLNKWMLVPGTTTDEKAGDIFLEPDFVDHQEKTLAREDFLDQFNTYVLLHKTALILEKFKVTARELPFLFEDGLAPDIANWPGWFSFNQLPVLKDPAYSPNDLFGPFIRLVDLYDFKNTLPVGEMSLFDVFKNTFNSSLDVNDILQQVADLTRWDYCLIKALNDEIFQYQVTAFVDEKPFIALKGCLELLKRSGAGVSDIVAWIEPDLTAAAAANILRCVKSKYPEEKWPQITQPLRDTLREKQRDALAAFLITRQDNIKSPADLYSYYLVDVEMSACMQTSRIKLAISAVQLFVQRCLLNLENKEITIKPRDVESWNQWKWMKNYRVWEANRKIFCYPENWVEPDLRDNKSPFFQELENELLQDELTEDSVKRAYLNYLQKLETVSNIEIMAICEDKDRSIFSKAYHVFGRTNGNPGVFYYRKWVKTLHWTPWERVDADIEGNHLVPFVFNGKLHLFWPVFSEESKKAEIPAADTAGEEPKKLWRIKMAWSEYIHNKWSAKRVTDVYLDKEILADKSILIDESSIGAIVYAGINGSSKPPTYGSLKKHFLFTAQTDGDKNLLIRVLRQDLANTSQYLLRGKFIFSSSKKTEVSTTDIGNVAMDFVSYCTGDYQHLKESPGGKNPMEVYNVRLLQESPPDQFKIVSIYHYACPTIGFMPFVYQDTRRSFAVKYRFGYGYEFHPLYHPFISEFIQQVRQEGVNALLDPLYNPVKPGSLANRLRRQQLEQEFFQDEYDPTSIVSSTYPVDEIDFSSGGAYSTYNWELFFHIPLLIATRLSKDQKFSQAQEWFHYIFDPTDTSPDFSVPQRFWKTKPFMEVYESEDSKPKPILEILKLLNEGDETITAQVEEWRNNPFNPHIIARMRLTAYQRTVVMKYIDNLIAWGDQLFRRDTIESINEATQVYMLAAEILGERPRIIEAKDVTERTYIQLQEEGLDAFGNAMMAIEDRLSNYQITSFRHLYFQGLETSNLLDLDPLTVKNAYFLEDKISLESPLLNAYAIDYQAVEKSAAVMSRDSIADFSAFEFGSGYRYLRWEFDAVSNVGYAVYPRDYWSEGPPTFEPERQKSSGSIVKTFYFCIPHNEWYSFLNPGAGENEQTLTINLKKELFPFMFKEKTLKMNSVDIVLLLENADDYVVDPPYSPLEIAVQLPNSLPNSNGIYDTSGDLMSDPTLGEQPGLHVDTSDPQIIDFTITDIEQSITIKAHKDNIDNISTALIEKRDEISRLNPKVVEDVLVIINYNIQVA